MVDAVDRDSDVAGAMLSSLTDESAWNCLFLDLALGRNSQAEEGVGKGLGRTRRSKDLNQARDYLPVEALGEVCRAA